VVELSTRAGSVPELHDENLERLVRQPLSRSLRANTPKRRRSMNSSFRPRPVFGHGFELLPAPDNGDVFFDSKDIRFGVLKTTCSSSADCAIATTWASGVTTRAGRTTWTPSPHGEGTGRVLRERRTTFPNMHVYHYNTPSAPRWSA